MENCVVTDGLTKEPNQQAFSIPAQAILYYFAMKNLPELKSTYNYDFRRS